MGQRRWPRCCRVAQGGLAPIEVPADIGAALKARDAANGRSEPSEIFADDVVVVDLGNGDRWMRGRAAAQAMASRYTRDSRFLPVSYGYDGGVAHIEGVVRSGSLREDEMNFALALRKDAGGVWRIISEMSVNKSPPDYSAPITADDLIDDMDRIGARTAVVLSLGYTLGRSLEERAGEYAQVRAENDWNVAEAQRFSGRLIVFCGVNPLRDYAVDEIARCAKLPSVRGVKLHLANSGFDLRNPAQLGKLKAVFRAAEANGLAIVMHQWTRGDYGAAQSRIVLNELLPAAPNTTVQIAHMAGAGPGYGPDDAMAVYAEALAAGDARARNLYFDLTTVVPDGTTAETAALVARRIRQVGVERVLFGSDMLLVSTPLPSKQWSILSRLLPLTDAELRTMAGNIAPYAR